MICLVDMEHELALDSSRKREQHRSRIADIKFRLEEVSAASCLVRSYNSVTQRWLVRHQVEVLVLSGNFTEWHLYDPRDLGALEEIIRKASIPILGLCGGLQFIALAHGAPVGPMQQLPSDAGDLAHGFGSGYLREWGFQPVLVLEPDPLFYSLEAPVFLQAHYWEVKTIPDGFKLLASTDICRVQVIRRIDRPVYGTQFHPEAYVAAQHERHNPLVDFVYPAGYPHLQPDGRQLLVNFLRAAGILSDRHQDAVCFGDS